jgi:phosphate-selective porin
MKNYQLLFPAVLLGLGVATTVSAQTATTPAATTPAATTPAATTPAAPVGMNKPTAPDNNMKATAPNASFSGWMTDYSKAHDGRISRQAYMDEAGKRWDSADKTNQGLTSDQINGMYGTGTGTNNSLSKDNKGK